MRYIKAFLIVAAGLFLVVTLLSLLIPSHVKVSRTTVINSSATDKIYAQVYELKNWKNWHPMFASDSAAITFGNTSAGANASCDITYNNKKVQLLINKTDSNSVQFTLSSDGENDISNQVIFYPLTASNETRVDWNATTHLHWYPWEKFYAIFLDKLTGSGYEMALAGLKQWVEKK
jgi:hypothetical protein